MDDSVQDEQPLVQDQPGFGRYEHDRHILFWGPPLARPHHEYIRALIYVSGPYTAEYRIEVDANIARAQYASLSLWRQGFGCITPHLNSARFERLAPEVPYGAYLETYMSMIPLCQGMLMLPGWEESKGARIERQRGIDLGLIVANHQVLLMTAFPDTTTWRQHA